MKVLFISRSTLNTVRGGDTTQVHHTAEALQKLGVEVDIQLAGEVTDVNSYDLVHFFNLIRPADALHYARQCRVPYVISSIYVDYSEFDQRERGGALGALARVLPKHGTEYIKTIGRSILGQDKLISRDYLFGHERSMRELINGASMILPNSESEAMRLQRDLRVSFPYRSIPNAVSEQFLHPKPNVERYANRILCVGQIEGRKNQHRLIQATGGMEVELLIVGKPSPNNLKYYDHCQRIAHPGVRFIGYLDGEELIELYQSSHVHALPSWFETTGLSSLEAGALGCNLVVSDRGDTKDYFDGFAEFCQPDDTTSIKTALQNALDKPTSDAFSQKVRENYTWAHTAQATLDAYKEVLGS